MTPRLVLALSSGLAVALAASAAAQPSANRVEVPPPVARMQHPDGWNEDARTAVRVEGALAVEGAVFPGVTAAVDAQAWTSSPPGAALIATQATATTLPADPAAAATVALHDLRAGADAVDGAKVTTWNLTIDPAGKVHEARLEWSEPAIGTTTLARALVYRAGGALVRIGGECILGPDGAAARATCEAILASLAPTATGFEPLAVSATLPPPDALAPPSGGSDGLTPPGGSDGARLPGSGDAPRMRPLEGEIPSTLAVRPAPKQTDRRPYIVVGGLAVLALVFWWNRREREKREAADRAERERAERKRDRRRGRDDAKRDDDDDDDAKRDDDDAKRDDDDAKRDDDDDGDEAAEARPSKPTKPTDEEPS